ncbi:MAG: hypothetical protein A2X42_12030 [Candidatus Margulisbacteria bacterium GWF2_38_17]|nr:MAG: hypothetical protein A2X43_10140 [Candidatus Margulisbacteria bacterium GWD2_39_127]OGI01513.1 MAG: hypothetical protein A2X42_12030 [Candidatus Margulisbacteria bacterium GWF2_38_17]
MSKLNCWEFKNCGREPGGCRVENLGVCSAALESRINSIHDGQNGGRACWAVAGTLCGGKVQGTSAAKLLSCLECDFFKKVRQEEKRNYFPAYKIHKILENTYKK